MYLQMLPGTFVENASFFDEKENFIVGAFLDSNGFDMFKQVLNHRCLCSILGVRNLLLKSVRNICLILSRILSAYSFYFPLNCTDAAVLTRGCSWDEQSVPLVLLVREWFTS